jgi:formylglycine-generating enzyme required for sulfatase activity
MTYYQILDVAPDATAEQIRNAYRILVQLHHPDRLQQVPANVREYAEERLKKINEAYAVLSDPERRASYDATQAAARPAAGRYAGEPAEDMDWGLRRRRPRRQQTAAEAEAAAAYEAWAHQEAERYAATREAERLRREERENRAAEARARRAAQESFPRLRRDEDGLVVHFGPGVWASLVRVPAGEFLMGSDPARDGAAASSEQPQHSVYVSEFYIARFAVTNAQFQVFAQSARHALPGPLPAGLDTHPVVEVDWDDADAFCQWLSRETRRKARLPTESEWEKAARGRDGRLYPWGNEWDPARANIRPDAGRGPDGAQAKGAPAATAPVDAFSPAGDSPYGLAGMSGNVWEWCSDWFDARTYARRAGQALRDPAGPLTGTGYVARGGAFDSPPRHARCAHRNWFYPHERRPNLGFRFVVEPF